MEVAICQPLDAASGGSKQRLSGRMRRVPPLSHGTKKNGSEICTISQQVVGGASRDHTLNTT